MARPQCDTPLVRLSFDEFCEGRVASCYLLETFICSHCFGHFSMVGIGCALLAGVS
jgi:hypothetical protein